jgi:hypothetical protein
LEKVARMVPLLLAAKGFVAAALIELCANEMTPAGASYLQ